MAGSEGGTAGVIVKNLVRRIPAGRAASYGAIGRAALALGRPIGGARTVAWILAALKGKDDTPWHRVVGAGGAILLPDRRGALQMGRLRREGVRFSRGVIAPGFLLDERELLGCPPSAHPIGSNSSADQSECRTAPDSAEDQLQHREVPTAVRRSKTGSRCPVLRATLGPRRARPGG